MNGWKAAWGEAGRGARSNFTTLRSLQWRPVWGGGTGATGRTWSRWVLLDRQVCWSDADLGRRGRRLRGSPQRAPGPRPAPPPFSRTPASRTLEAPADQPSEATGQPRTRVRSPAAPPATPRSASGASLAVPRAREIS